MKRPPPVRERSRAVEEAPAPGEAGPQTPKRFRGGLEPLPSLPPGGLTREALGELFAAFSRASSEMERSHTELKAEVASLQKELAEKDRLLERKKRLEALGLMVAGVAHEFRNPLGSVSLYLDCLSEAVGRLPAAPAGDAGALIQKIETAIRHLNAVVEDMLIFTRGPAGPQAACSLPRLIEEALLLLRSDLDETGVLCQVQVESEEPGGPSVRGDRDQMVRIVMNVLKNAIQAVGVSRPRGEGRVEIAVRRVGGAGRALLEPPGGPAPAPPEGWIEVAVRDNGPGVPPERLERLFVPFYTEKQGGVGLGLSIVHSLLERQGGRVEVENAPEGGLLVRIQFSARMEPALV